jgi:NDP-sugar pyrophosphorylase family protein
VSDWPKVLANINGKAFLDILLAHIRRQGFQRIILSIGYRGAMVKEHFREDAAPPLFSEESQPLGTGGALAQALHLVTSDTVIVLNGDTFCDVSLKALLAFHTQHDALLSIVLSDDVRPDGGGVVINEQLQISHFQEKKDTEVRGLMNAGAYIFRTEVKNYFPPTRVFSLEHEVFPAMVETKRCFGFVVHEKVVDIGTPDRYVAAHEIFI